MSEPAFLTTREVADLLRVKERKVYEMAADGAIPHRRVTNKLLFPKAEIDAWLGGGDAVAARPSPPAVIAGSHDPLLDWAIRESGSGLATAFDGSLAGLEHMANGTAAAAGLHVFDPVSGDWNLPAITRGQSPGPWVLIEWAKRQQGLILSPAIAGDIASVADLAGRRVVQRQPSAGAALLFDHLLDRAGLARDALDWLPEIARTETEAAAAVASDKADAAPGLEAAARQFRLDFLPTRLERFDLLVERRAWFEPPLQKLIAFTRTPTFADKARDLGGYDLADAGTVHWNGP